MSKKIRKMTRSDLISVIEIHRKSFQGFFLEQMGNSFLEVYYRIVLAYSDSIAYVVTGRTNSIEGFVVGFIEPKAFYKKFKRSIPQLLLPILLGILRNPKLLLKVFENVKRISFTNSMKIPNLDNKQTIELSSIAVNSASKGTGTILLNSFVEEAWSRGVTSITLTTDLEKNESAQRFYLKNGFKPNGIEARKNRNLIRYVRVNETLQEKVQ